MNKLLCEIKMVIPVAVAAARLVAAGCTTSRTGLATMASTECAAASTFGFEK